MNASDFDKAVGTAVRQALHNGVTPCLVMGILEAMKMDVYSHMNENNKNPAGNGATLLTPQEFAAVLKQKRGGN